jgi:hypothetical protein
MNYKDLREESRKKWGTTVPDKVNPEEITLGCMLRIADAVEVMVTDRVKLEKDLTWYKNQYHQQQNVIESFRAKVKGMASARSRYKNQIDQLRVQLSNIDSKAKSLP